MAGGKGFGAVYATFTTEWNVTPRLKGIGANYDTLGKIVVLLTF